MKAVDYFMLTSFGFIFAALIEYIIVLNTPNALVDSFYCSQKKGKNEPVQAQVNNTNKPITWCFLRLVFKPSKWPVKSWYCYVRLHIQSCPRHYVFVRLCLVSETNNVRLMSLCTSNYIMASSISIQDESNSALWLATRASEIELSCPFGTTRRVPQEKIPRKSYNDKFFTDQACSIKMAR